MACIVIDSGLFRAYRKWIADKHDGETHGYIKRETEAAIKAHMKE